jgi:hypothetical protein
MKNYDLEKIYIPGDGHFDYFGNEIVAEILSEYLLAFPCLCEGAQRRSETA